MRTNTNFFRRTRAFVLAVGLLCITGVVLAQDGPLTIPSGTLLTVRTNEAISSDRNQPGDAFSATLTQPVIVQGIVVAQRGQTVAGRIIDAKRAGLVSGTSHLQIALTSLTLADGQDLPIRTQLLARNGRAAVRRDTAVVAETTGAGALIGAIAGGGRGAAIGAGAGVAAGTLGVLLTRGYPTVIYPESMLTFEVVEPIAIDTGYAPQAFHAIHPENYQQAQLPPQPLPSPAIALSALPPPVEYPYPNYASYAGPYSPYYYDYYARPYYYGPSIRVLAGRPYYNYRPYYAYRHGPRPIHVRGRVILRDRR